VRFVVSREEPMMKMDEAEWLEGDPADMLAFVHDHLSDRQQRLIPCAFPA
jgi:hypothetical protein